MTTQRVITINHWGKFQQYKDRRPNWIKLFIEIIDEFDVDGNPKKFHKLPDSAKLTFVLLACLRANYNNHIPYPDDNWLKTRLGIGKLDLQPIIEAGFISINNTPVRNCTELYKKGTPETETETETEKNKLFCPNSNSAEFRLSELLQTLILSRKPDFKKPNLQQWAKGIDKMIRIDKRKPDVIEKVIIWCQADCGDGGKWEGWQNNILSTIKLREKFDKLELAMNKNTPTKTNQPKLCFVDKEPATFEVKAGVCLCVKCKKLYDAAPIPQSYKGKPIPKHLLTKQQIENLILKQKAWTADSSREAKSRMSAETARKDLRLR